MVRLLLILSFLGLLGCAEVTVQSPPAGDANAPAVSTDKGPQVFRSSGEAVAAFNRISREIRPLAVNLCKSRNRGAPPTFCDFRILVHPNNRLPPNAFQTIGRDGRPIIAFTRAMFSNVRNEDEIAFILSHEAGHQIARHILQTQQNQQLGALILGSAAASLGADVNEAARLGSFLGTRVYSQEFELEADRIGTILAHRAGYNPRIGALSFNRFGGKGGILSTHPASQRRIQTVNATMKQLEGR